MNNIVKIRKSNETLRDEEISLIQNLISDIRYGCLTLKIQDGKLIQIDKNEKIRFK